MMIIALILQEYYLPPEDENTAFAGYLGPFADLIMAGGAILAIMAAYRIYQNAQLGNGNLYVGATNLILGMIFLLVIRAGLFLMWRV